MKEIIHIVGLNNEYKKDFIFKIHQIDPNYNIIDIDDITQKINSSPKISKLYDEYEKVKIDKVKSKTVSTNINTEWSRELQLKLNKMLSLTTNDTILIGLTTSVVNTGQPRIYIDLPTNYKFIIDTDVIENAKQIIRNNLKEFKNEIINGSFPLDFLNLNYLIKRREQLNQVFLKNMYIVKKTDDILKFLKEHIKQIEKHTVKKLYYASDKEINKYITTKGIIFYDNEIISILNLFKLANLKYDRSTKTVIELSKDSLKELEKDCYIYEITDLDSVFFDGDNFKNNKKVKINKNTYVDCIYDVLHKLGIKFNKYKDK
jgi:hypothetical protein